MHICLILTFYKNEIFPSITILYETYFRIIIKYTFESNDDEIKSL